MKHFLFLTIILVINTLHAQPPSWTDTGIGGGGSLFSPTISPSNANIMYMQCDMSEVFHTTDAGLTWDNVHFKQLISTGGKHRMEFTSDPNILYTVNLSFNEDLQYPVKSTNGGNTWNTINDPTDGEVWSIFADPSSTSRIIISSYDKLYISTNGGSSFIEKFSDADALLISGVFWDGNNIFVGTNRGLVLSTDSGSTFNLDPFNGIPANEGFLSFTGSKSGGITRLMGTTASQNDLYPGMNALDIEYYSTTLKRDFGVTNWISATAGIAIDDNLYCIASSINNSNVFYVGGTDPNTSYPVIYKTINGGSSWNPVFLTNNNQNIATGYSGYQGDEDWYFGEIVFGLAVAPNDANTVIFTDFGFAHISQNGGTSWRQAYVNSADQNPMNAPTPKDKAYKNNGLENTSCWNLHWKKDNSNNIFASYTDITGVRSLDGGSSWAFDYNGITYNTVYHVIEHPVNNILYAAVSSVHDMYQSTYLTDAKIDNGTGAILYSTDGGINWQMFHNFNKPVIWLAIDPTNTNRMYASVVESTAGGIYKSDNINTGAASSWALTTAPPRTQGHPYNVKVLNDGVVVSTWSGRRPTIFTASSGVFKSANQGLSWIDVSKNDDMYYWTKDITIDPNDITQNTWYVSVHSGWGGAANDKGGLYKTTNRGVSWTKFFDSYRVESSTVDPVNANNIYVTTESEGLWYSSNATNPNPTFTQLLQYDFMHPLRVVYNPFDPTKLFVTSFGNGIKSGITSSIPLPIEILSFNGIALEKYNLIYWSTNQDPNIKSFDLQKLNNKGEYKTISILKAKEKKADKIMYEFKDFNLEAQNYYRLMSTDNNGSINYSAIINISKPNYLFNISEIYPQPVSDGFKFEVYSSEESKLYIEVYNTLGNRIYSFVSMLHKGNTTMEIDTKRWKAGVYAMCIKNEEDARITRKIIK